MSCRYSDSRRRKNSKTQKEGGRKREESSHFLTFYVCEFLFEFFSSRFLRHVLCVVRVCFFCLCLSLCLFVDWRRRRGKEEQKPPPHKSLPSGNRTNATDVCFCLFVFYHVVAPLLRVGGTRHGRRYKCSRQEGFTVQRVHRTQCRLVCTRRDLGGWAGPVGQVGAGPVGGWVGGWG